MKYTALTTAGKAGDTAPIRDKREKGRPRLEPLWETEARAGPKMEARAHILQGAASAFTERGYAATTLDHVAEKLGTTKGQIYHYYRSKVDLYYDVVVGAFFMINEKVAPIADLSDLDVRERLRRLAHAHAVVIINTYSFQRVALEATQHQLIASLSSRQERAMSRILRLNDEYEATVSRIIAEGAATGAFEVVTVPLATKAVLGALNWLTVWFDPKKPRNEATYDRIANGIADFVVAGLLPNPLLSTLTRHIGLSDGCLATSSE
jgi:AcrR family transcriptional regulator